ncbi:hypothetical protein WMY93_010002 [Mugilogobius chulae]|uniref:SET domain-containing protein n=1 Tax=Mugilogobius chulae TaxID=88201 RepID=A0AAW0PCF0_9GOBI
MEIAASEMSFLQEQLKKNPLQVTKTAQADFRRYCQALLMHQCGLTGRDIAELTVDQWLARTVAAENSTDFRLTAGTRPRVAVLPVSTEQALNTYFQFVRATFVPEQRPDGGDCDRFFISSSGLPLTNPGADLQRFQEPERGRTIKSSTAWGGFCTAFPVGPYSQVPSKASCEAAGFPNPQPFQKRWTREQRAMRELIADATNRRGDRPTPETIQHLLSRETTADRQPDGERGQTEGNRYCVDATDFPCPCHPTMETFGRRMNHSRKNPNVKPRVQDLQFPEGEKTVIVFYAPRDISPGEELLWDYGIKRTSFGVSDKDQGSGEVVVRAECFRSMKKAEKAHKLRVFLKDSKPIDLVYFSCLCKAGKVLCNHCVALLFQSAHYSQLKLQVVLPMLSCTEGATRKSNLIPAASQRESQNIHDAPPPPSIPLQDFRLLPSECMFVCSRRQQLHLKSLEVTLETAHKIEGQSLCADWHNLRRSRVTASRFREMCHVRESTEELLARRILKGTHQTGPMKRGLELEADAIWEYCQTKRVNHYKCGFVVHPDAPWLGASPDGIVFDPTEQPRFDLIEVKCPNIKSYVDSPYLKIISGTLQLKESHAYHWQGTSQERPSHTASSDAEAASASISTPPSQSVTSGMLPMSTRTVSTQLSTGTLKLQHVRSKGVQTKILTIDSSTQTDSSWLDLSSTPVKAGASGVRKRQRLEMEEGEEEDVDISDISLSQPHDSTYDPGASATDVSEQYIVFESSLKQLFQTCPICKRYCNLQKRSSGTFVSYIQSCPHCLYNRKWDSQPLMGSTPVGNLQLSAAVYFSGGSYIKMEKICKAMNLQVHQYNAFRRHSRSFLEPAIYHKWKKDQETFFEELKRKGKVAVGGDMRADSQSNEVGGSFYMEKEGLKRGLDLLEANSIEVDYIVTDRHTQVKTFLRGKNITQYYDVWHLEKGLSKKLEKLSKEKECQLIKKWLPALKNHIYWVASSSKQDQRKLQSTVALYKVEKLLVNKRVLGDVKKLSSDYQTSSLEAFHSVIIRFAPKSVVYPFVGMMCRNALQRKRETSAGYIQGTGFIQSSISKIQKGKPMAKPVKTKPTYEYVSELMRLVFTEVFPEPGRFVEQLSAVPVPEDLSAQFEKVPKEVVVSAHVSRFSRAAGGPDHDAGSQHTARPDQETPGVSGVQHMQE